MIGPSISRRWHLLPFVLLLILTAAPAVADHTAPPQRQVLLLHSYHQGMSWADRVTSGFSSTMTTLLPKVEIRIEYMDTKRIKGEEHLHNLLAAYRHKFAKVHFDVVVVVDDIALQLVLKNHDLLFPGTPVVFCGINNFSSDMMRGRPLFTGVVEKTDVAQTLKLALDLHPRTSNVYIINDTTETGKGLHNEIAQAIRPWEKKVKFTFLEKYTIDELAAILAGLPEDSIVLRSAFFRDSHGTPVPDEKYAASAIDRHINVPEYGLWDTYLGLGIVGGQLVTGFSHGETAARIAARIVSGEKPSSIPIEYESPNRPMFDYNQLKRFGIPKSALPTDSIIINEPRPFYAINKPLAWIIAVFTLLSASGVILLVWNIRMRKIAETVLRQSESNLREVFNCAADGIYIHDMAGNILQVNPGACAMLGYQYDELLKLHLSQIDSPSQAEMIPGRIATLQEQGHCFFESEHRRSDGHDVPVEVNSRAIDYDGTRAVLSVVRDISERKRAEEALKESEERLRVIFESSKAGIMLVSSQAQVTFANGRMAEMFGCRLDELIGASYADLVHPAEREAAMTAIRRVFSYDAADSGTPRHYIRRDGSDFWGYITGRRLNSTKTEAAVGIITDMTELQQARRELEQEKERLSVTLRSIGDGVITVDTEGRVVLLNRVAEQLCGWNQVEAQGRLLQEVFNILNEHTRLPQANPVDEVLKTGRIVELANHTLLIARDGAERIISDSAAPIHDSNSSVIGVVLVFRDMTEKKKIEDELFKNRKLESLGILAGGIAHDFNNLLTGVVGNISVARMAIPTDHKAQLFLDGAERGSQRARELTNQLLTFSKGGAPVKKLTSISSLLTESTKLAVAGSRVRCCFDISEDLWPAEVDAGQISQVLSNLAINAVQAMHDGGVLFIRARNVRKPASTAEESWIEIVVEDEGAGIAREDLVRIFDPYFTTKPHGNGLGLATVHSIISNHDGEISVSSKVGVGTAFTIRFPAAAHLTLPLEQALPEVSYGQGRVLVMDDENLIREVAASMLSALGYEPTVCQDGGEAVRLYTEALQSGTPYAAVIMDLTIPGGMGGKEAVAMILEADPQAKVIVSSGYSSDTIIANYGEHGFRSALVKPYNSREMGLALQTVLSA